VGTTKLALIGIAVNGFLTGQWRAAPNV